MQSVVGMTIVIVGVLAVGSVFLYRRIKHKEQMILAENTKLLEQLHESRITLMMSQIQPHFIYNTLGTIRALIKTDPDKAYDMVYNFSTYLRANIDAIGNHTEILFSEELKHVAAYVEIEKVRFGERLQVIFDIEEDTFYIPPLCVQALVENAIKHGICQKPEGGCVWIRSYTEDNYHIVEVEDNGAGFEQQQKQEETSTGIKNIEFRLKEISNAGLSIESEIKIGTKATIKFLA